MTSYEIPEDHRFAYPWAPSTQKGAPSLCVSCGARAQATETISEYPFRFAPPKWHVEARTQAIRCNKCVDKDFLQPEFYAKYEVHLSQDGSWPKLHIRPRERLHLRGVKVAPQETTANENVSLEETDTMTNEAEVEAVDESEPELVNAQAPKTLKARAKDHFADAGSALALGVKLAAVNEIGEVLLDISGEMAKDSPMMEALLESPEGRELAKMGAAMALLGLCHYTDAVPRPDVVAKATQLQLTVSGFQLMAPRMNLMRKHMQRLVGLGEKLAELEDGTAFDSLDLNLGIPRARAPEEKEHEEEVAEVQTLERRKGA